LELFLPDKCSECDCRNLKIQDNRISENIRLKVRCMRCGEILWSANQ